MWINQVTCCLLAVASFHIITRLVHSQGTDSSQTAQNLTCITHNLIKAHCSWTTASRNSSDIQYNFCLSSSFQNTCSVTQEKIGEFDLHLFAHFTIRISTVNSKSGKVIGENTFPLSADDIDFVPSAPSIHALAPNFSTNTLHLEWSDGGEALSFSTNAIWQIQILRKMPMEEVALGTYHSKVTGGKDTLLHWNWTSDLPFECTTHYVRIRCFLDDIVFPGNKKWSEWSQLANIPGNDTGLYTATFPLDPVVQVGTTLTFCCVWQEGESLISLKFGNHDIPQNWLSNWSTSILVQNITANESGSNIWCAINTSNPSNALIGSVLSVGYPPDVPQNLNCETEDLKNITCKWQQGRPTELYGDRGTTYELYERISGENVTLPEKNPEKLEQKFSLRKNQEVYNFTVHASNPLGQSEASLSINVTRRVHPKQPDQFKVRNVIPTAVELTWRLLGSFAEIQLWCQIQVTNNTSGKELHLQDVVLDGGEDLVYTSTVNKLQPYTEYVFKIHCAAAQPLFWKWSDWSKEERHRTSEASPATKLDIWREKNGEMMAIFWKPLPISAANGVIKYYEVSWCQSANNKKVAADFNSTSIDLLGKDCVLSVMAKNQAGFSPPSTINSTEIPVAGIIATTNGIATGDGVNITWPLDPDVTCGYTVRWCHGHEPCAYTHWEKFPSSTTNAIIKSSSFKPGVPYRFSVYGCKDKGHQLLSYIIGYIKELKPKAAPRVSVLLTTSDSISIEWKDIPVEDRQGFLKGYVLFFGKGGDDTTKPLASDAAALSINITNPNQNSLKISSLQRKTSYRFNLHAYTAEGLGPPNDFTVVTKENAVGLIIAIIIPVAIALVLAVVTSVLCYRKREWIKETFYPDIPNPENCKALEFPKDPEGNPNSKTLEMNPCTPNIIEVVETQSPCQKIEDTAITSPMEEELPEDGFDSETESHTVVSYCPPIIEEEISNAPVDEPEESSKVIYIDIQSMYPAQPKSNEVLDVDCMAAAGYKPQMHLPVNSLSKNEATSSVEEDLNKAAGYRPQVNTPSWNTGCPDSPRSIESNNDNASFGSPCSINSRQFLIPPKEDDDSPEIMNSGWSFTNFFHSKSNV